MKRKNRIIIIVTVITLLLILIVASIVRINRTSSEAAKKPTLAINISTGKAIVGEISEVESLTGNILSVQQAGIYSKVSGNIEKISSDIGDNVRIGQLLALIDTTIYSQNVKLALANYNQTKANLANTKLNFERNKSLLDQNLISKQDVDNSETAYNVALAQMEASYANYINSKTMLSYCRITAPFNGVITKRYFDAGVYVNSSANQSSSTLFILTDLDHLKAKIYVPEKDIKQLSDKIRFQVIADALTGKVFNAKLRKVSGAVDLSTRTMEVEIDIENSDRMLKPGMFIIVNLIVKQHENALILPNEVILNDQTGDFVFVVNKNHTVSKKMVKLGLTQNNRTEILSGINENDLIVFSGQNVLRDGSTVKVTK